MNNLTENKIQKIVDWLKEYLKTSGAKGYVIGLSGGVDSTATAALAVEAVGVDNVYGLILPLYLPNENERPEDIKDAKFVANYLNINYDILYLSNALNDFVEQMDLTTELKTIPNIKARIRMTALRAKAEKLDYLVLGTTNLIEDKIGYFTKGGDGGSGVDIEPIADLYKSEVFQVCECYGFPDHIARRTPTAGLYDEQTDEKEIGYSYEILDNYFAINNLIVKNNANVFAIVKAFNNFKMKFNLSDDDLDKIATMVSKSDHKRNVAPKCCLL
jgi:NAD+ synthase